MKKIIISLFAIIYSLTATSQSANSATEVMDYREVDGRIVITMLINGVEGEFILDLAGHNSILADKMAKYKINTATKTPFRLFNTYQNKQVTTRDTYSAESASYGNNAFGNAVKFFELTDSPYLAKIGVDGVIGTNLFQGVVLTIDTRRKKITTTMPYRPPYMKLNYRANMELTPYQSPIFDLTINGIPTKVVLDTWSRGVITLNSSDYAKLSSTGTPASGATISNGYNQEVTATKQFKGVVSFINSVIEGAVIAENNTLNSSVAGMGLLEKGVISIDFGKKKIYFQPFDLVPIKDEIAAEIIIEHGKLNSITRDFFIKNIHDYKKSKNFVSQYNKPIVIDFWATWCGPCMKMMPQMEALAAKYKDKVVFMKVNADKERELCNTFGIQALPTLFFITPDGKPMIEVGLTPDKVMAKIEQMLNK